MHHEERTLIREKELLAEKKFPGSRSTLYREIAAGRFPRPVKISARSIAWIKSEIDQWAENRAKQRDAA